MKLRGLHFGLTLLLAAILVVPGVAIADDDRSLLIGRWSHLINADIVLRSDGTYKRNLDTGEWTIKSGQLIFYSKIFGKNAVEYTVTRSKLRITGSDGIEVTYTRE